MTLRHRSRGSYTARPVFIEESADRSCASRAWAATGASVSGLNSGDVENMWDTVVPGFHKRRANGEVFFNDMQHTRTLIASGGGTGGMYRSTSNACSGPTFKGPVYRIEGDEFQYQAQKAAGSPYLSDDHAVSDQDIADACLEVSTKVRSQRGKSNTNLYEDLAEINKTLGMLGQALEHGSKVLSGIPRAALRGATDAYLLYRYGFSPVVQSVGSIVKSLKVKTELKRETTRAFLSLNANAISQITNLGGTHNCIVGKAVNDNVKIRGMSLDEYVLTRSYAAGFSTKGLLSTPWELVPYSFVYDWIANVGDYIGAFLPSPSFHQLGSALAVERIVTTHWSCLGSPPTSGYTVERNVSGSCTRIDWAKWRTQQLPEPGLVIRSDFRFSNLTRSLDAAALVLQKLITLRS